MKPYKESLAIMAEKLEQYASQFSDKAVLTHGIYTGIPEVDALKEAYARLLPLRALEITEAVYGAAPGDDPFA